MTTRPSDEIPRGTASDGSGLTARYDQVRAEWLRIGRAPAIDLERFRDVKHQADELVAEGKWTSGPGDMLSILGRHRDELAHSRLIAWLLLPTNRHGLGRTVLTGLADHLWPGEQLFRSGPVVVDTEVPGRGADASGRVREARADIVVSGDGLRLVIENKLDAGEQPQQCERLYWAWAAEPGETRWVFLTPTGWEPQSFDAASSEARGAWRSLGYAAFRAIVRHAVDDATPTASDGRHAVTQYLATLAGTV